MSLRKHRNRLSNQLNICTLELEKSRALYDVDTQRLREELHHRENSLNDIFNKYVSSQQDLSERLLEAGELMDLVRYNAERYESLTNNLSCSCARYTSPPGPQRVVEPPVMDHPVGDGDNFKLNKTFLFSDKLGSGFGSLLQNYMNHSIINYCCHNYNFKQIVKKVSNTQLEDDATVILLLGNSMGVKKRDIVDGIDTLLKLKIGKTMLCAFPYSDSFSQDVNNGIYRLNNLIYTLTCCHSDKLLYFDTNKFVSGFKLTQEAMFLPRKCKYLIATLIAYNINAVIGNITQCRLSRLSDETVLFSNSNNTIIDCLN